MKTNVVLSLLDISPKDIKSLVDEVHVWTCSINALGVPQQKYYNLLSSEEQLKVSRFYFQQDRWRYIYSHGILRLLLARYAGCQPAEIVYKFNQYGKPSCANKINSMYLHFNLSHSEDQIGIAISLDRELGIDIEYMKDPSDVDSLASGFLTEREIQTLCLQPFSQRIAAFYKIWTRKEAYVKGTGLGLSLALNKIEVASSNLALSANRIRISDPNLWLIQDLPVEKAYSGALAIAGREVGIRYFQMPREVIR